MTMRQQSEQGSTAALNPGLATHPLSILKSPSKTKHIFKQFYRSNDQLAATDRFICVRICNCRVKKLLGDTSDEVAHACGVVLVHSIWLITWRYNVLGFAALMNYLEVLRLREGDRKASARFLSEAAMSKVIAAQNLDYEVFDRANTYVNNLQPIPPWIAAMRYIPTPQTAGAAANDCIWEQRWSSSNGTVRRKNPISIEMEYLHACTFPSTFCRDYLLASQGDTLFQSFLNNQRQSTTFKLIKYCN